jgi:hypothetical protein
MSAEQYSLYSVARDRELEESKRGVFRSAKKRLQKPGGSVSSYRVRSRQISNFLYPESLDPKRAESLKEGARFEYVKDFQSLRPEHFDVEDLKVWGPKILKMLQVMSRHVNSSFLGEIRAYVKKAGKAGKGAGKKEKAVTREHPATEKKGYGVGPVLVYSQFLDSGILVVGKALERYGMKQIREVGDIDPKHKGGSYCVISGEVDPDQRTELLKLFTSPNNMYGEIIAVLLFTATGAEGMDTKYVRAVLATEPYWHWARMEQVFYRGIRLGSLMELPEDQRNVQPYLFLADYPYEGSKSEEFVKQPGFKLRQMLEDTTDVTLYTKAVQNRHLINKFLEVMQESSIDCSIWAAQSSKKGSDKLRDIKCRICKPTGRLLFIEDLDKDMKSPSACEPMTESKIMVKSVMLVSKKAKKEYKYSIDGDNIHVYEYDDQAKGYKEIEVEHPDYLAVYNAVAKKEKIK